MTLLESTANPLRISQLVTSDNWDTYYWLAKQYTLDPEDWDFRYETWEFIPEGLTSDVMDEIVHYFEAQGVCFEDERFEFDIRGMRSANFAFLYGASRHSVPVQVEDSREGWAQLMLAMLQSYGTFVDPKLGVLHDVPEHKTTKPEPSDE